MVIRGQDRTTGLQGRQRARRGRLSAVHHRSRLRHVMRGLRLLGDTKHGPSLRIPPWSRFTGTAIGARMVPCGAVRLARGDELDLVRTETEDLTEFAHLRYLRLPPAALPEVDGLRLDAHG